MKIQAKKKTPSTIGLFFFQRLSFLAINLTVNDKNFFSYDVCSHLIIGNLFALTTVDVDDDDDDDDDDNTSTLS